MKSRNAPLRNDKAENVYGTPRDVRQPAGKTYTYSLLRRSEMRSSSEPVGVPRLLSGRAAWACLRSILQFVVGRLLSADPRLRDAESPRTKSRSHVLSL